MRFASKFKKKPVYLFQRQENSMFAVEAYYENGEIRFKEPPKYGPSKVIITFLEDETTAGALPKRGRLDYPDFSFERSQELLKDLKTSLSDEIVEGPMR